MIARLLARRGPARRRLHLAARRAAGPSGSRSPAPTPTSSARSRGSGRTPGGGATQFEVLTAAAFAEFAARGVDVAVVEAGLGGRHDATNVLGAPRRRADERRARPHRRARRDARGRSPPRSSRSSGPGAVVVLGEPEWEELARAAGAARVDVVRARTSRSRSPPPRRFLGRAGRPARRGRARAGPARAPRRAAARDLGRRAQPRRHRLPARRGCPTGRYTLVASILADKDAEAMLRALAARRTRSSRPRRRTPRVAPGRGAGGARPPALRARRGDRRSPRRAGPRASSWQARTVPSS